MPENWRDDALAQKWDTVQQVRRIVLHALEPHRKEGTIRANLEAHPVIYVEPQLADTLGDLDFAEICITSQATLTSKVPPEDAFRLEDTPGVGVAFHVAQGNKCQRCWKILPEVGQDPDYPDLSPRDADAVRWYLKNRQAA
jgi:isoleucyl-tRNA synthetase